MPRKTRKLLNLLFAVLTFCLFVGIAPAAFAHATLIKTDPQDGATLEQAPPHLRIWFNEPVMLDFTRLQLEDSLGHVFVAGKIHRELDAKAAQAGDSELVMIVADLPALHPGAYHLFWQTRSQDDLHVIQGSVIFGIQQAVAPSGAGVQQQETATQPFEVVVRWLDFLAFSLVLGAFSLRLILMPLLRSSEGRLALPVTKRLTLALRLALPLSFSGNLLLFLYQGALDASWMQILFSTPYGYRWLASQLLLGLLVLTLFLNKKRGLRQDTGGSGEIYTRYYFIAGALLLAVTGLKALNGHSTTAASFSFFSLVIDTSHLAGASFWSGGLLILLWLVLPLLKAGSGEVQFARRILSTFSKPAAISLATLAVTGLLKSGQQVASLDGLLTTLYGQALLFKVDIVLLAALSGLMNAVLLHRGIHEIIRRLFRQPPGWHQVSARHLRRILLFEGLLLVAVLGFSSFLASSQPPRGPEFQPALAESDAPASASSAIQDLIVTFSVKPDRPGENFINLGVLNTRRPAPAPIGTVGVKMRALSGNSELNLAARQVGEGHYQIAGNYIDRAGDWQVTVEIERPGLPDAVLNIPWKVLPASGTGERPVVFSNEPLAPLLDRVAVGLLVVIVTGAAIYLYKLRGKSRAQFDIVLFSQEHLARQVVLDESKTNQG